MDRRQLLLGMATAGLAGQFDLTQLAGQTGSAEVSKKKLRMYPPDIDLNQPRGPIKTCIEESTLYDGALKTQISEYAPDGKMISSRWERDGKVEHSTSDNQSQEIRDEQGRLVKFVFVYPGQANKETYYSYDAAGRMLTETHNDSADRTDYSYAPDGTMTSVQTFDPRTIERTGNAAFGGSAWDAAVSGFGVPTGGRVVTTYDQNKNGIDQLVYAADSQLVSHSIRKYDADEHLLEESVVEQNLGLLMLERMPAEQREALPPEYVQMMSKGVAALSKEPPKTRYRYDDEGRLTRMLQRSMAFEVLTTIGYNEQGDRIEERKKYSDNSRFGIGVPISFDGQGEPVAQPGAKQNPPGRILPPDEVVRYSYQYDEHGNWTERVAAVAGEALRVTRRTLTYY
jgi:YD repeat-containing protein